MPDLSLTKVWTYLASTTGDRIARFIADNVTSRIFLLHQLNTNGMRHELDGGYELKFPVFKELATATAYTDLDTLTPVRANPTTVARWQWKQLAVPVVVSGRDMLINSGDDVAIANVLTHMIEVAEASMREGLSDATTGIFSAADDTSAAINGLQNSITHTANATPTAGTAGGLSRATFTFWRNQVADVADAFATNGIFRMHDLYTLCMRGDEMPDVICLTRATYLNYLRNTTNTIRYNLPLASSPGMLDLSFSQVTFNGATMGFDQLAAADMGYFLNSKYAHWVVHPRRNLELGPFIVESTQDALKSWLYFAGNLCFSNMARQGLLRRGDTN